MADFRVTEEGKGKFRIEEVSYGEGCSTIFGIIIAVIVLAFILTNCSFDGGGESSYNSPADNSSNSGTSNEHTNIGGENNNIGNTDEIGSDKTFEESEEKDVVYLVDLVPDKHGTWQRRKNELKEHGPGNSLRIKDSVRDAIDDDVYYNNALTGGWDWYGEYDWNEYELNGEYKIFSGMLITGFWANQYPNYFQSPKFVFEVDGSIVAEYELGYKDKRVPVSLDISGAQRIRIYIYAESVNTGQGTMGSQRTGYLVDARIQK